MIFLLVPAGVLVVLLILPWTRQLLRHVAGNAIKHIGDYFFEEHERGFVAMLVFVSWFVVLVAFAALVTPFVLLSLHFS